MDIRKLQRAIVDGLEDVKAQNIAVFNTEHLSPLFERVIIASGTSNRQTKALAASVRDAVKSSGLPVLRTEGEDNGEWIIVDCGAAVAHIMQPAIRAVLPPRRDLGQQAGEDEDRQRRRVRCRRLRRQITTEATQSRARPAAGDEDQPHEETGAPQRRTRRKPHVARRRSIRGRSA